MAWATVTVGMTVAGPGWLAAWLAVCGLAAATQAAAVWRKRGERPMALAAGGIAAGIPLAASLGVEAVNGAVVAGVLVTFVARLLSPTRAPSRDIALTLVVGIAIGLAAASPVLMRHAGIAPALLLLCFAAVYDAGAYLVGTGAASAWEGPAAGVAALVPLTIFTAVILIPPFSAGEPLVLGLLAAVLAPLGPMAGSALLGDGTVDAPGLRRLDSLLVLGPIWAWCALIFLR
jgi:CDP-diglyceride synthetase